MVDFRALVAITALLVSVSAAQAADTGLIKKRSEHSVGETLDSLETLVKDNGFTVFARIDHAAGAAKTGASLRPTQVLIFGNPKAGTPLIESAQTMGLDLPIRVLAWEDAQQQIWLAYHDPHSLAGQHGVMDLDPLLDKMTAALNKLTNAAAKLTLGDVRD